MQQAVYHHANSIASQIKIDFNKQLDSRRIEVLRMIHPIPLLASSRSNSDHSQEPLTHHANSATNDVVQLEILKPLKQIQLDMKQSARPVIPFNHTTPNCPRKQCSKTPDAQT